MGVYTPKRPLLHKKSRYSTTKRPQKIRKYIREDDRKAKEGHPKGQIDWGYLLKMADGF